MDNDNRLVYDLVVVGAGPAGTVFIKEISEQCPELKIALIDGQSPDNAKPCGGLLAPDAQKLLARFDLVLPKSVLEDPQIFAVETIDIKQKLVRYYQRHYLNMDRYAFDTWLLSFVPPNVTIYSGRCVEIHKNGDLFNLSVDEREAICSVTSKIVVGADGGGSLVRRSFFRPISKQYVAIQQRFQNKSQSLPYYSCIFDSETSDSCSWTIHKGDHVIFGGAFKKQGCRKAFDLQKSRLEEFLGSSFGDPVKTEACLVSSPRRLKDFCTGNESVFLLGEAAGFISASSFEGISYAMFSGKTLADAFANAGSFSDVQKLYRKNTRSLILKLRAKAAKRSLLCNPVIRKIILKTGIQSIKPYREKQKGNIEE